MLLSGRLSANLLLPGLLLTVLSRVLKKTAGAGADKGPVQVRQYSAHQVVDVWPDVRHQHLLIVFSLDLASPLSVMLNLF